MAQKLSAYERESIVENVYNPFIYTCMKLHKDFREAKIENPDDPAIAEIFKRYDDLLAFLQSKRENLRKQVINAGDTTPWKVRVTKNPSGRIDVSFGNGESALPDPEGTSGDGSDSRPSAPGPIPIDRRRKQNHDIHSGLHLPAGWEVRRGGREGGDHGAVPDQEKADESPLPDRHSGNEGIDGA